MQVLWDRRLPGWPLGPVLAAGLCCHRAGRSLPGAPVDALAQQVGVASVPGVLLDQVDKHVPRGDSAIAVRHLTSQAGLFQRVEPFVSPGNLGLPGCEGVVCHATVWGRACEVPVRVVWVLVKARTPARLAARAGTSGSPPGPVADQSQQAPSFWAAPSGGQACRRVVPRTSSRWSDGSCLISGRSPFHRRGCGPTWGHLGGGPHVAHGSTNPRPATPASDLRCSHHQQVASAADERPGDGQLNRHGQRLTPTPSARPLAADARVVATGEA